MTNFSLCETPGVLRAIFIIKQIIIIIKILVPIMLMLKVIADIFKSTIASEDDIIGILKKNKDRMLCAVSVFFVPTLMGAILTIVAGETKYASCYTNANINTIQKYQLLWDAKLDKNSSENDDQEDNDNSIINNNSNYIASSPNTTLTYKYFDSGSMPYALYSPSVEENSSTALIVWLHGSGERNSGESTFKNSGFLSVLNNWSLQGINSYVLCPHMSGSGAGTSWLATKNKVMELIDKITQEKNINRNKIILVGHSLGGKGVLSIADGYADKFSALVVLSGYNSGVNTSQFSNTPIKGFVGYPSNGEDSTSYNYMVGSFSKVFGSESNTVLKTSHGKVPKTAFNLDENNDGKSDLIEWMLSQ